MTRRILLVRHTAISEVYKGRCYGRTDVDLSPAGRAAITPLAARIATAAPDRIVHSGLSRTRLLAETVGARVMATSVTVDDRLLELDFGSWENRTWDDIYAADGDDIGRLVTDPQFAPPQGESLAQLSARVVAWYRACPDRGTVVAITHGGPIAALLGTLSGAPATEWPGLIPDYGTTTEVPD